MKKNMGMIDRSVRVSLALGVGLLYLGGMIQGVLAIVLAIMAIMFLVTSLFSHCPMYFLLNLSTRTKIDE